MDWDRERRQRPLRSPRIGDVEAEGGYGGAQDPWRSNSTDHDSPAARRRQEKRKQDRRLLRQRRQLEQEQSVLLADRDCLHVEQARLKLMARRIKREHRKLVWTRRLGLGLLMSSLTDVLARNEAAAVGSLADLEHNKDDLKCWEAEWAENALELTRIRLALERVWDRGC